RVGGLSFGVVADETDNGDSIEVHTFLLVPPDCRGHPKSEWARLPRQEAVFLGGPERGSQNRKGARAKQKLRSRRAPQKPRSSAETNGQDKGTQPNGSPLCWSHPPQKRRNPNHSHFASSGLAVAEILAAVV